MTQHPTVAEPAEASASEGQAPELKRRLLTPRTLISFLLGACILIFLFTRLDIRPREVWHYVRGASVPLLALAASVYYGTFILRAYRWRWMLAQAGITTAAGYEIPRIRHFVDIFLLSWFVNCVVPAKLGDGYRCFLIREDAGVRYSTSLGTIVAERLVDLSILFLVMTSAGVLAFRGHLPTEVTQTLLIGLVMLGLGIAVVSLLVISKERAERFIPLKFRSHVGTFREAIAVCITSPWRAMGISFSIWMLDGVRLLLVALALGAHISPLVALFVTLMAALLTALPITPGGLGVVEAAMVVVLKLVDVDPSLAVSIAVVDRLITYWSLILVGCVLYVFRVRYEVRLSHGPAT